MKALIIALITVATMYPQDKRFAVFAYTQPTIGPSFGAGIEYQRSLLYTKAQAMIAPDVNGLSYFEVTGTPLGFNYHSYFDDYRLYGGARLGLVRRGNVATYPFFGLEAGADWYFRNLFIGLGTLYDYRSDNKAFRPDAEPYWQAGAFLRIGFEI